MAVKLPAAAAVLCAACCAAGEARPSSRRIVSASVLRTVARPAKMTARRVSREARNVRAEERRGSSRKKDEVRSRDLLDALPPEFQVASQDNGCVSH